MGEGFFKAFETKHLIIGICCTVVGWGFSQIYTLGIQQAAMVAHQEDHANQLELLSPLPQEVTIIKVAVEHLAQNDSVIVETLKDHEKQLYASSTRLTILETEREEGKKNE